LTSHRVRVNVATVGGTPRAFLDASTAIRPALRDEPSAELVPALTIAAHPSPARVGERLILRGLAAGQEVLLSRSAPEFLRPGSVLGAPLADPFVSRQPVRIAPAPDGKIRIASDGGTAIAVGGAERGAAVVGPLEPGTGVPIVLADRIILVLHQVESSEADAALDPMDMVGSGLGISRLRRAIAQIADLRVPVLLRGETGTGKELVARALHDRGPRRAGPFVSVNLGAISKELAAAELFGAVRGAYTGATREREGLFRAARGGTLFLDEVGEASPELQVMLLRVLETGELYPVGGDAPIATDVRVIAATDADLEAQIRDGRFKAPLLHRLAGHELYLPPLRERVEDLGILFHHFAREDLAAMGEAHRLEPGDPLAEPWLPASIALRLLRFRWPGNIRQLRNVTRQLVIGSRGRAHLQIEPRLAAELDAGAQPAPAPAPAHEAAGAGAAPAPAVSQPPARSRSPSVTTPPAGSRSPSVTQPPAVRRRPAEVAEPELIAALRANAWDLKAAADHLGIPRASIYDVIERCPNVRTAGDLTPEEIVRCHRECGGDLELMAERLEVSRRALGRRAKELGLEITKG
jgi:two-component system, NtrC family, nitrogen regulation response regulator GlnG